MSRFTLTSLLLLCAALACSAQHKIASSNQIRFPTGPSGCVYSPAGDTCVTIGLAGANGVVETGDYTADGLVPFVQMNCASPCTLTLPSSIPAGFGIAIERTGAGAVTIDPNGNTYDGATSIPLQYEFVTVWTDGTGFHSNSPWNVDSSLVFTPGSTGSTLSVAGAAGGLARCADTSGSGTAQSCTTSPSFTPGAGSPIVYSTTTANTGDVTVNVNSLGAKHVRKWLGSAVLAAGDLPANVPLVLIYDGTYWEASIIGNAPSAGLTVVASGSTALATSEIESGLCQTVTDGSVNSSAATGAVVGNKIVWTPAPSLQSVSGYEVSTAGALSIDDDIPSGGGYVEFNICNWTTGPITPGAVTLYWSVLP